MKLFITGSGTGVGKTLITAAIARQLRMAGEPVTALKPIVSGLDAAPLEESDPGLLLRAQGLPVTPEAVAAISPWRYGPPISPDMAAELSGRPIDIEALIGFCKLDRPGHVLVEGVGGAMVPLDRTVTVMDWMSVLGWPTWMVVGSYLGTLSHTLTAAEACRSRGVPLARVLVSESIEQPVPLDETVESLRSHLDCEVVGVRRVRGPRPWERLLLPSP